MSCFRSSVLSEDTLVVDVASRAVVDTLSGLRPAIGFWGVVGGPRGGGIETSTSSATREGRVLRIDFATGERKVVAGTGAAARRADQRPLSVWIITSRARPDASARSAMSGSVSRRNAASSAGAQARSVARHQDRRAHAAAHHQVRGGEAGDAAVRVVERQDLDEAREGDGGRLIGREIARAGHFEPLGECREAALDELGRRGRSAVPLPHAAAQARPAPRALRATRGSRRG